MQGSCRSCIPSLAGTLRAQVMAVVVLVVLNGRQPAGHLMAIPIVKMGCLWFRAGPGPARSLCCLVQLGWLGKWQLQVSGDSLGNWPPLPTVSFRVPAGPLPDGLSQKGLLVSPFLVLHIQWLPERAPLPAGVLTVKLCSLRFCFPRPGPTVNILSPFLTHTAPVASCLD